MAVRRPLPWIMLLAAGLHLLGMARAQLPAQDGLKFIRVARQFRQRPWIDVIRGTDQHPLYPAAIALAEPAAAALVGPGPDSWRIAAQGVSALASIALLLPLFGLSRALFGAGVAALACLIFAVLPLPTEVGHDTLGDSLALLAFTAALYFGQDALSRGKTAAYLACGLAAGLGYLTRPEALVAPLAVILTGGLDLARRRIRDGGRSAARGATGRLAVLGLAFLVMVGSYALVKGEISEKLPLRLELGLRPSSPPRKLVAATRTGLDDPRLDFSAKEESGHGSHLAVGVTITKLLSRWSEDLGWIFPLFVAWGLVRVRAREEGAVASRLLLTYSLAYVAILVRHASVLGYLSNRHALTLVIAALPWAAAGVAICANRAGGWFRPGLARGLGIAGLVALIGVGVGMQLKTPHLSRWGHREAGRWLAGHAGPADAVLDTRGWAAFVAGRVDAYDSWHIRQALSDARLRYVVVGEDELAASSRRAATLRALLDYAAEPAASFPESPGGTGVGVRVFRFHRPESWEGLRP